MRGSDTVLPYYQVDNDLYVVISFFLDGSCGYDKKETMLLCTDNADRRGNLTAVSRGEEQLRAFTFDAANRMRSAYEIKDGIGKRAEYTYNAFGNRIGQDIYGFEADNGIPEAAGKKPQNPEQQIYYTLDLTRQYHNLLISEDKAEQKEQTFYWDGNVAAMATKEAMPAEAGTVAKAAAEEGMDCYYLQDDLGSPMQLVDEEREIRETYGFDEFGLDLGNLPERQMQPFGYTGYQMEAAGGRLYFAQARRYDAEDGRFISEDKIPGFTSAPFTLNRYNYCWNQPMEHVDLNGKFPVSFIIDLVVEFIGYLIKYIGKSMDLTSKTSPEVSVSGIPTGVPNNDSTQQDSDGVKYMDLTEEEKLFVATVCGESIDQGELQWRAVSNIIMNRKSSIHFPNTVTEVIQFQNAFSAYQNQNWAYRDAMNYLENRTYDNELYEEVINITIAIYRGDDLSDITQGATLFYNPKLMNPPGALPPWNFDILDEVYIDGIDSEIFRSFRYKDECLE